MRHFLALRMATVRSRSLTCSLFLSPFYFYSLNKLFSFFLFRFLFKHGEAKFYFFHWLLILLLFKTFNCNLIVLTPKVTFEKFNLKNPLIKLHNNERVYPKWKKCDFTIKIVTIFGHFLLLLYYKSIQTLGHFQVHKLHNHQVMMHVYNSASQPKDCYLKIEIYDKDYLKE